MPAAAYMSHGSARAPLVLWSADTRLNWKLPVRQHFSVVSPLYPLPLKHLWLHSWYQHLSRTLFVVAPVAALHSCRVSFGVGSSRVTAVSPRSPKWLKMDTKSQKKSVTQENWWIKTTLRKIDVQAHLRHMRSDFLHNFDEVYKVK